MAERKRIKNVANDHDPADGLLFDKGEYNKVVGSAKLITIQLSKLDFSVDGDFYDDTRKRNLHFDRGVSSCFFDAEGPSVVGTFSYSVYSKSGRKRHLAANAEFLVIYSLEKGVEESAAKVFCMRVGMYAAFPYFRGLMANVASAANAPLPPLPVIATKGSPISVTEGKVKA